MSQFSSDVQLTQEEHKCNHDHDLRLSKKIMLDNFTSIIYIDCWGHRPLRLPVYYAHSQVSFK